MFGFTVNPLCEIVIPVVRFATGPIRDPTKKMMIEMISISERRE